MDRTIKKYFLYISSVVWDKILPCQGLMVFFQKNRGVRRIKFVHQKKQKICILLPGLS